jgi:hypothetical protein
MKRLAPFLAALTASLAVASTASAYVIPGTPVGTSISSQSAELGGNQFHLDTFTSGDALIGIWSIAAINTAKPHSAFSDVIDCIQADALGQNAGVLARVTQTEGQSTALYGYLIHVSDFEDGTVGEQGIGDRIDITSLSQRQYQRQLAIGCAPTGPARSLLLTGNISIQVIDGSTP